MFSVHLSDYDSRTIHYGFFVGGQYAQFTRRYSNAFVNQTTALDTVHAVSPKGSPGYVIGFIVSYAFDPQLDFAVLPSFAYYERSIIYDFSQARSQNTQTLESGSIELPMLLRYKSLRRGNIRMYMLGGLKPSIQIGSNKKDKGLQQLRINPTDLSVEYGFGFDLFYPYFKLSPELRFSHGLTNMLVKEDNVYSHALKNLRSHSVSFLLYF
jgi:hypothetical protein